MDPDFSFLFHQSSKDHAKGHPPISRDPAEWPAEWKTVYYKAYHRLPKIALPETAPRADFFDLIRQRGSQRSFGSQALSIADLSSLLKYSCGTTVPDAENQRMRRAQASGGARYPIEVYPFVFRGDTQVPSGVYHYNVKAHALDVLWERSFSDADIGELFTYSWVRGASVVFVMTAVFRRNQMKYGERGYRYILLEAGHIAQNLHLVTEALGLKSCALGGTYDAAIEKMLDLDGIQESVVYAVAVGR